MHGDRSRSLAHSRLALEESWAHEQVPSHQLRRLQPLCCAVQPTGGRQNHLAVALPGHLSEVYSRNTALTSCERVECLQQPHYACIGTGRAIGARPGRRGGAASASTFPIGQLTNAAGGSAEGSQADEAAVGVTGRVQAGSQRESGATQRVLPRLRPSTGPSRGGNRSPLFNIRGHLGVGLTEGRRSPRRMQEEEGQDKQLADDQVH